MKCIIVDIFMFYFKKYLHSFIQFAMFTRPVARRTNRLHVLRMIVKLGFICYFHQSARTHRDLPKLKDENNFIEVSQFFHNELFTGLPLFTGCEIQGLFQDFPGPFQANPRPSLSKLECFTPFFFKLSTTIHILY